MRLLSCCAMVALRAAGAAWVAAPLEDFPSEASDEGDGVRHFRHEEHCQLAGGGSLALQWALQADPASLLSLDAAPGVQMIGCEADRLALRLPARLLQVLRNYKYVVASRHVHNCAHLQGDHIYRRVLRVASVAGRRDGADVVLETLELASASEVVPGASFSVSYVPQEALSAAPEKVGRGQLERCPIFIPLAETSRHHLRGEARRTHSTDDGASADDSAATEEQGTPGFARMETTTGAPLDMVSGTADESAASNRHSASGVASVVPMTEAPLRKAKDADEKAVLALMTGDSGADDKSKDADEEGTPGNASIARTTEPPIDFAAKRKHSGASDEEVSSGTAVAVASEEQQGTPATASMASTTEATVGEPTEESAVTDDDLDVWKLALRKEPSLSSLGKPVAVKTQVVAGTNYIFTFASGETVTVFYQPWTKKLEITDQPEGDHDKSTAPLDKSTANGEQGAPGTASILSTTEAPLDKSKAAGEEGTREKEAHKSTRPALVIGKRHFAESRTAGKPHMHLRPAFVTMTQTSTTTTTSTASSTEGIPEREQVERQNALNFVPRRVANFGWNWDFATNTPKQMELQMAFPGGNGFLFLKAPHIRVHSGITVNFTSRRPSTGEPFVRLEVVMNGQCFIGGDMSAIFNVSNGAAEPTPLIDSSWETTQMEPLEFFLGNIPVRLTPGARIGLDASYLGQLHGSLRMGMQARLKLRAALTFDSRSGLHSDFAAEPLDGRFWPPTWLLESKLFGLTAFLQPEVWVNTSLGSSRNLHLKLGLKPHINVSLVQGAEPPSPTSPPGPFAEDDRKLLVAYPFRVVGLKPGEEFAVKVVANGREKMTSTQIGYGVIEYSDPPGNFDFGEISEAELLMIPIQVSLLRHGKDVVATAGISCDSHVNGECTPSPAEAKLKVDGREVVVQLTVLWKEQAVKSMEGRIRSISVGFQGMRVTRGMSKTLLAASKKSETMQLQLTRSGRTYTVPTEFNASHEEAILLSNATYELGPCLLDSWHTRISEDEDAGIYSEDEVPDQLQKLLVPTLELLIDGKAVGRAELPEINWAQAGMLARGSLDATEIYDTGVSSPARTGSVPVGVAMHSAEDDKEEIGMAVLNVGVLDAGLAQASFWIYPHETELLRKGKRHNLIWKAAVSDEDDVDFTIGAFQVNSHGHYKVLPFEKRVQLTCRYTDRIRYLDYDRLCVFNTTIESSKSLTGRVAFVVRWTRDEREHMMVSVPVDFTSGADGSQNSRRLPTIEVNGHQFSQQTEALSAPESASQPGLPISHVFWSTNDDEGDHGSESQPDREEEEFTGEPAMPSILINGHKLASFPSSLSLGPLHVSKTDVDYSATMKELTPHCSTAPLHYSITLGTFFRTLVVSAGLGSKSDFDSGWVPLAGSDKALDLLADSSLLPKAACNASTCTGTLPGCAPGDLPSVHVPHLDFELSRSFHWTQKNLKGVQHVLAMGLAILPEALEILDVHDGSPQVSLSHKIGHANDRRLMLDSIATRRFSVRLLEPLPYRLDRDLAQQLLLADAWRGLADGREAELGPVVIRRVAVDGPLASGGSAAHDRQTQDASGHLYVLAAFGACLALFAAISWCCSRHHINSVLGILRLSRASRPAEYDEVPSKEKGFVACE